MVWFKVLGSLLVLAASGAFGLQMAANLRRRPKELADLRSGLQLLETEIVYGATPLPAALTQVATGLTGTAGDFFRSAGRALLEGRGVTGAEGWAAALAEVYPRSALARDDLEALRLLGVSLGASDRREQVKHLGLCKERLANLEARSREDSARYGRVWSYGGVLSGLMLVLVLL